MKKRRWLMPTLGTAAVLLGGCRSYRAQFPDGTKVSVTVFMTDTQIGRLTVDKRGTMQLDNAVLNDNSPEAMAAAMRVMLQYVLPVPIP